MIYYRETGGGPRGLLLVPARRAATTLQHRRLHVRSNCAACQPFVRANLPRFQSQRAAEIRAFHPRAIQLRIPQESRRESTTPVVSSTRPARPSAGSRHLPADSPLDLHSSVLAVAMQARAEALRAATRRRCTPRPSRLRGRPNRRVALTCTRRRCGERRRAPGGARVGDARGRRTVAQLLPCSPTCTGSPRASATSSSCSCPGCPPTTSPCGCGSRATRCAIPRQGGSSRRSGVVGSRPVAHGAVPARTRVASPARTVARNRSIASMTGTVRHDGMMSKACWAPRYSSRGRARARRRRRAAARRTRAPRRRDERVVLSVDDENGGASGCTRSIGDASRYAAGRRRGAALKTTRSRSVLEQRHVTPSASSIARRRRRRDRRHEPGTVSPAIASGGRRPSLRLSRSARGRAL